MIFRPRLMRDSVVYICSSISRAHLVLQVLPAHRDLLDLRGPKWPRKFFSRSSKRWLKVATCWFSSQDTFQLLFRPQGRSFIQFAEKTISYTTLHPRCQVYSWYFGSLKTDVNSFWTVITWICFCQRLQRGDQQHLTDKPAPASYLQLSSPWRGWPPTGE